MVLKGINTFDGFSAYDSFIVDYLIRLSMDPKVKITDNTFEVLKSKFFVR